MFGKCNFKYATLVVAVLFLFGCKQEEPECIPSGKKNIVEVEKSPLPKIKTKKKQKDLDYCKACVRSATGFFSCQTAWEKTGEKRVAIKERAKAKACQDAGYKEGECPSSAVLLQQCKGDEKTMKPTKLTNAMKNLLSVQASPRPAAQPSTDKNATEPSEK